MKLYFVKDNKRIKYYNRYGQVVTKQGKIINPEQTASDKVIPGQNITKVYKDNKVVTRFKNTNLPPPPPKANFPEVKKGTISNIPPPTPKVKKGDYSNIPPPPPPMSAIELVSKYPNATYYFNNEKISHKKVLGLVKNQKGLSVLTQEKDGKKIIKFTSKDYVKKGLIKVKNQALYYINKNGKTEYFDRWGNKVNKEGKALSFKKIKKERTHIISTNNERNRLDKLFAFPKGTDVTYYLDEKPITKKEMAEYYTSDIKTMDAVKDKNGKKKILMTSI